MTQLAFWIITPDDAFGGRWAALLRREGWQVAVEQDFERFTAEVVRARFGIGFLDWDALRGAAPEAVRRLKAKAAGASIVLVSGPELGSGKVIEVLEAGADDHLLKDLDEKLVLAKLKAHLRRILPSLASALDVLRSPGGEIRLDRSKHEAQVKGGQGRWAPVVGLTRTEFQILALFLEQPGKVLERQFILETIWQSQGTEVQPGTVDKHIESLRRKLGRCGSMVKTVYGVGYAFREA